MCIVMSHFIILSLYFLTSSSFIFWISPYLSRSAFSKCLNFFYSSLNYLVILLYSPVNILFLFLNSRSFSIYSFVNFLNLLFKFISFLFSSSHKWTFSSCFSFNTCKIKYKIILANYNLIFQYSKYTKLSYLLNIFLNFISHLPFGFLNLQNL